MQRYVALSATSAARKGRDRPRRFARHHTVDLAGIGVSRSFSTREPDALRRRSRRMLPAHTVLITGAASRAAEIPDAGGLRAYNSIYVIDHDGAILAGYDKLHLVPFGEYLPFQDFLERLGLMQLTKLPGRLPSRRPAAADRGARAPAFLPLICYEVIFPAEAVPPGERPGWLLNLTNDAWFGISSGPYQHFQQARVRAIEEGLPLVRAANDGISAVIDPVGRVVAALALGREGVLDSLPTADRRRRSIRVSRDRYLFGYRCSPRWLSVLRRRMRLKSLKTSRKV